MTQRVPLSRGLFALVDDEDFHLVRDKRWHAVKGTTNRTYYARHTPDGPHSARKCVYMHRLVLGLLAAPRNVQVDHVNGDSLDNRRANLRTANAKQNGANRVGKKSMSGFKGVYPVGTYRWRARIGRGVGGCLGEYDTAEDAARAYDAAARERYGAFARVNFPNVGEHGCVVSAPVEFDAEEFAKRHKMYGRNSMRRHRAARKASHTHDLYPLEGEAAA